jgi:hypothetical protein
MRRRSPARGGGGTRRGVLAGGMGLAALSGVSSAWGATGAPGPVLESMSMIDVSPELLAAIADDLDRYVDFGSKRSGGAGDEACGAWLERRLAEAGYVGERQAFEVPFIEDEACALTLADGRATPLLAQAPWVPTPPAGIEGPLAARPAKGAIAVVELSHRRWSTAFQPEVQAAMKAARAEGAAALVLVTNGPSGEALALNASPEPTGTGDLPLAILAPMDAAPVRAAVAAGGRARLTLAGRTGRRPAWNLIGRLDRGHDRWLVISTPRSGWFTCGGERGPGIGAWLQLIAWAARAGLKLNIAALATSGHEFENLGGHHAIAGLVPPPGKTALWLHLGANVAARDWHEAPQGLQPLPSADPQRFLVASPPLLDAARAAFAGLPGLEVPYPAAQGAAGELGEILKAGYPAAGIFGAHRLHHARIDDGRALYPPLVVQAAIAAERFLKAALG